MESITRKKSTLESCLLRDEVVRSWSGFATSYKEFSRGGAAGEGELYGRHLLEIYLKIKGSTCDVWP
jgi:hypothetical protein